MITFSVSPVATNPARLPTIEQADCLRGRGIFAVEATSAAPAPYLDCQHIHGLVVATHRAFSDHYPLVLSPDAIWLCLAQGLARHINAHAETLRSRLVRHAGQIELEVRRDHFTSGDPANDWPGVLDELSEKLGEHLGGRRDLFVADFSTTDFVARAASQIVLLGGVQQYFTYLVGSLCGIPEITLEGTPDDWAQIRRRARVLHEFDLGWWADALDPVLAGIEEASKGRVDQAFWQDFYKLESASGGERVTGWLNALFPYLGDESSGAAPPTNPWFAWRAGTPRPPEADDDDDAGESDDAEGLVLVDDLPTLKSFPSGLTSAPFTWRFLHSERAMSFVAGFFGVVQDASGALRPQLGWAVTPALATRRCRVTTSWSSGLRELSPRDTPTLTDLSWLPAEAAGMGPFALSLGWCKALSSLAGVSGLSTLEELSIIEANLLENLDDLAGLSGLKRLSVSQCAALRDVSALATLPALEALTLMHCPSLVDLSPIADLPRLSSLDLWGRGLPEGLAGRHQSPEAVREVQRRLRRS